MQLRLTTAIVGDAAEKENISSFQKTKQNQTSLPLSLPLSLGKDTCDGRIPMWKTLSQQFSS